jgi:hypothetical protein
LKQPGSEIEGFFPSLTGSIHLMRGKTMQKEGMKEQRQEPMNNKEKKNREHALFLKVW